MKSGSALSIFARAKSTAISGLLTLDYNVMEFLSSVRRGLFNAFSVGGVARLRYLSNVADVVYQIFECNSHCIL